MKFCNTYYIDDVCFVTKWQILALENRVLELENLLEKGRRSETEVKERHSQLQREIKELTNEYIVLKSNHLSLTQDYQQEVMSWLQIQNIRGSFIQGFSSVV